MRLTILLALALVASAAPNDGLTPGRAPLQSANALAFGPDGILFVGDSLGGAVFALDTNDRVPETGPRTLDLKGLDRKIAALLGTAAGQILIYDTAVNPISKNVYIAVSRGRGPDAIPVIIRVDGAATLTELSLSNIRFASAALSDAPENRTNRRVNPRTEAITALHFVKGNVMVAGLSNEEFSSRLRVIPFPFHGPAAQGTSVEIFHTSHGEFETNSPVRTFVPYTIAGRDYILAAYTCTPLVKIPVSDLLPGAKVTGETIAELGAHNRPLDMIAYRKDGHDYLLMANSARGVMRYTVDTLGALEPLWSPTGITNIPHQRMGEWKQVHQLKKVDENTALILADAANSIDLRTISLP